LIIFLGETEENPSGCFFLLKHSVLLALSRRCANLLRRLTCIDNYCQYIRHPVAALLSLASQENEK